VRRAIWLGETAGLLDERGRTVPRVSPEEAEELLGGVGSPAGTDVTGGMRLRLATAFALARRGIPSLLADGRVPGLLERVVAGEAVPGTVVAAG
jgi:isopentenyl phosphate kinase